MRTRNITIVGLLCLALVPAAFAQNTAKPAPKTVAPPTKMESTAKKPATTTKKKMPPRDPKTGKFIKATPKPSETGVKGGAMTGTGDKMKSTSDTTKKKMPPRDPKTGKFIKAPKP